MPAVLFFYCLDGGLCRAYPRMWGLNVTPEFTAQICLVSPQYRSLKHKQKSHLEKKAHGVLYHQRERRGRQVWKLQFQKQQTFPRKRSAKPGFMSSGNKTPKKKKKRGGGGTMLTLGVFRCFKGGMVGGLQKDQCWEEGTRKEFWVFKRS